MTTVTVTYESSKVQSWSSVLTRKLNVQMIIPRSALPGGLDRSWHRTARVASSLLGSAFMRVMAPSSSEELRRVPEGIVIHRRSRNHTFKIDGVHYSQSVTTSSTSFSVSASGTLNSKSPFGISAFSIAYSINSDVSSSSSTRVLNRFSSVPFSITIV